ncbi:hypothetical protein ACE1OC_00320 [Streptomyces sp. DSM 116496]|uniref:hypothetical protein n=1 Tax=Streptomyces stoeckheimensis TaxID=3344656 RepID=UPI0038B2C1CB
MPNRMVAGCHQRAHSILRTLAAIALAGAALSLAGPVHAEDTYGGEELSVTDFAEPRVVSFLPGGVDETWIVAF